MNDLKLNVQVSSGFFVAIQDEKVLGIFDSFESAKNRVEEEKRRDEFALVLKRKLLKKLIKSGNVRIHDYYISEIKEVF